MASQDYEQVTYNGPAGAQIGSAATEKVSFYGAVPVVQRASAFQAASVVSVSSNFTIAASLVAWALEVTNTLVGMGIWKGAA
jgi:hypothetical protein